MFENTNKKVVYKCGCEATGDNVATFCPIHGDRTIKGDTKITSFGIDLSLTGTGLSVLDGGELLYSECYKPKNKSGPGRLIEIRHKVSEIIDKFQPGLICLEGYSFGSKGRAVFQTGELGGLIRVLLHKTGIKWIEIPPSQVKKFATGKGNCGKDIVLQQVYKRWGMEFKTSDEADAFVLAKIGTILLGHKEKLIKAQDEVIKVLKESEPAGVAKEK